MSRALVIKIATRFQNSAEVLSWYIILCCINIYFIYACVLQPSSQLLHACKQPLIKKGKSIVSWTFYNVLRVWAIDFIKTRISMSNMFHLHVARWKKQTLCEEEQTRKTPNALNTKGVNAMQWFCFCYRKCKNSMLPGVHHHLNCKGFNSMATRRAQLCWRCMY